MREKNHPRHIIFPHWVQWMKSRMGYDVDLDTYKLFIKAILDGSIPTHNFDAFVRHCKYMFLQQNNHAGKFSFLLEDMLEEEFNQLIKLLEIENDAPFNKMQNGEKKVPLVDSGKSNKRKNKNKDSEKRKQEKDDLKFTTELIDVETEEIVPKYIELNQILPYIDETIEIEEENFVYSDEYFPVSRKHMVKNWRYVREKEQYGYSDLIDVKATVKEIAKINFFLKPIFQKGKRNKSQLLTIFADVRGSMLAFEKWIERFVETAKAGGGLKGTKAYYFQNVPDEYVYEKIHISEPRKFQEVLEQKKNKNSVAVVISDAGAVKGRASEDKIKSVLRFWNQLNQHYAYVVWLNPMPIHRWKNTSCAIIAENIERMYPLMDIEITYLQSVIKSLINRKNVDLR